MKKNKTGLLLTILSILVIFCYVFPFIAFFLGQKAYVKQDYVKAFGLLNFAYHMHKNNEHYRYYYAQTLTKLKPILKVQKYLFEIAESNLNDGAKRVASKKIEDWKKEQISYLGINNYPTYKRDAKGNFTQDVAFYNYDQTLKITSDDPELINKVYLQIPSLIQKGITVQAFAPEYYYSDLNKKKAELLKAATADAKVRAQGMLKATNNRVGKISSVKMGVMQITPADSNEVSDWGINDSSTIDKKITAVANVVFSVK